jgi:prolyl oligopeptidase
MAPLHLRGRPVRSRSRAFAGAIAGGGLAAAIAGAALLSCSSTNPSKATGGSSETAVARTQATMTRLDYPVTKEVDQVDDYHGTKVADPYRWLESTDSPETRAWITEENAVTRKWLDAIPARARIEKRVSDLINYERRAIVARANGVLFFRRNPGLLGQDIFWMERPGQKPVVVLDPNTLSKDGTVSIGAFDPSEDARFVAYAVSDGGSDWHTWRVRDLTTMQDLPDVLRWSKFSGVAWLHDGSGFHYCRYPEPKKGDELEAANYFQKLYFHRLGDLQEKDELIYERPDQKEWFFGPTVSDDGRYLVLHVSQGTDRRNRIYFRDLQKADSKIAPLLDDFDASYDFLGNVGTAFYFKTDLDAPRGRIIAVDLERPAKADWKQIVPTSDDAMSGASLIHHQLVLTYLHDASSRVRFFRLDGTHDRDLELPGIGSAAGFGGKVTDKDCWWSFVSFVAPPAIRRYDFETGKSELWYTPKIDFDVSKYETRLIFARSKDGTAVPIHVTARKGIALDGSHPCLLYGYGGFNIAQTPSFSTPRLVWLEMGGIYAQAVLRGGGEYGETWHEAGMLANKQNVFDDFIAAAEHLIDAGYTRRDKLAIHGGSNGGLLVGACLTQRPDLFGAAVPQVGVLDMLRYHEFTIGWAWASEYGRSDHADQFPYLYKYSPLHRLAAGTKYPPTLIVTGDHDDRVLPAHSFKFAAALQKAQAGDAPVLIRIETRAGHGAGKSTQTTIEEQTDLYSFLAKTLRIEEGPGAP